MQPAGCIAVAVLLAFLEQAQHLDDGRPLNPERFTGFLHVLDAMLAFAARQTDLDRYAADLDAAHQRTLAAWAALSRRDN